MSTVVQYWNEMYRNLTGPVTFSGGQPTAETVEAAKHLCPGARVIDIGCGDGREALFLAESGFAVTAHDISPVAIDKVKQFACERGVQVEASVQDIRHLILIDYYDLIVCHGCLHLIEREYWLPLLHQIQQHTHIGGYNAVGAFTDTLPAPDDQQGHYIGLLTEGELFELYDGWEIISQRAFTFNDQHPGGISHHHAGNTLLARKR